MIRSQVKVVLVLYIEPNGEVNMLLLKISRQKRRRKLLPSKLDNYLGLITRIQLNYTVHVPKVRIYVQLWNMQKVDRYLMFYIVRQTSIIKLFMLYHGYINVQKLIRIIITYNLMLRFKIKFTSYLVSGSRVSARNETETFNTQGFEAA